MVQFDINTPPSVVRYGYDEITGLFLQAEDERLMWDEQLSEEANEITQSFYKSRGDGGGGYFDLHTGLYGFGLQVTANVIEEFFRRFGVSEEQISHLRHLNSNYNVTSGLMRSTDHCGAPVCGGKGKFRCSRCHQQAYCSSSCQKSDWRVHRPVCLALAKLGPQSVPSLVSSFFHCLNDDVFPPQNWERVFGVKMPPFASTSAVGASGLSIGHVTGGVWQGLRKTESISEAEVCDALWRGTLPLFFEQKAVAQYAKFKSRSVEGYLSELFQRGFRCIHWDLERLELLKK